MSCAEKSATRAFCLETNVPPSKCISFTGQYRIMWHGGGLITKLCPTLCNTMDYSLPDSSVHGISQARTLEWVVISEKWNDAIMMTLKKARVPDPACVPAQSVTQSCLTLCDLTDCSLPGSSVHGISQARTLE